MTTQTETNTDTMLKARDVCARWKISRRTLRNYVSQGKVRAYRLPGGTHFRFRADDVRNVLEEADNVKSGEREPARDMAGHTNTATATS